MDIESKIRSAVCRVDYKEDQLGSAFWVDDSILVTAAHVVEDVPEDSLKVKTDDGHIPVRVCELCPDYDSDPGPDLAILSAEKTPEKVEVLAVDKNVPSIGRELTWSGYAKLFGEDNIDRQRFGWGKQHQWNMEPRMRHSSKLTDYSIPVIAAVLLLILIPVMPSVL